MARRPELPSVSVSKKSIIPPMVVEGSLEEQAADPTPEIVSYLTNLLIFKRKPIDHNIFDRDREMYRRSGQYGKALPVFLREPKVLALGDDMRKREIWMEVLSQSYQGEIDVLHQDQLSYRLQRGEITDNLGKLNARIAGIGNDNLRDFWLLKGRVQVDLWQIKQRGRLNILGKLAERVIGSRQIHPQVEPYQEELTEVDEKLKDLGERRQSLAAEHFQQDNEQKGHLETYQEKLLHHLDDWVINKPPDFFLVHYLYYQRPNIERYLRNHALDDQEQRNLLSIIGQHKSSRSTKNHHPSGQSAHPVKVEVSEDSTRVLPMALMIEGKIFTEIDSAREEFAKLKQSLSEKRKRQIWGRLLQTLKLEAQGLHHPESTLLGAEDMIERVGGDWRLTVGRYRVIGNLVKSEAGQKVLEVVSVLQRNDPKYY